MSILFAHQRIRRAMEEKKKARQENEGTPQIRGFGDLNIAELKKYAKDNDISISGLTKKEDIKTRIIEAENRGNGSDGVGLPVDGKPDGNGGSPDYSEPEPVKESDSDSDSGNDGGTA